MGHNDINQAGRGDDTEDTRSTWDPELLRVDSPKGQGSDSEDTCPPWDGSISSLYPHQQSYFIADASIAEASEEQSPPLELESAGHPLDSINLSRPLLSDSLNANNNNEIDNYLESDRNDLFNFINTEQYHIKELDVSTLKLLNDKMSSDNFNILLVNIRSLEQNFELLESFILSLNIQPCVIICTEAWIMSHSKYYKLQHYLSHYNNSTLNRADGVVSFIKDSYSHEIKIEVINNFTFMHAFIRLSDCFTLKLTSLYRCHTYSIQQFNKAFKKLLLNNVNENNHVIAADFNIDILTRSNDSDEFLNNLLELAYIPYFNGVTRPESGTCIDNIVIKSKCNSILSLKYTVPLTDHYSLFVSFHIDKDNNNLHNNEMQRVTYDYDKLSKL